MAAAPASPEVAHTSVGTDSRVKCWGAPPSGWQVMLRLVHGFMEIFGRITMLVGENVHAVNLALGAFFMVLDRGGSLYAELARFVFRLLGLPLPRSLRPPQPMQGPPQGPHGAPLGPTQAGAPQGGVMQQAWQGAEK